MTDHVSHRDQLIAELTARLRPVCADWPEEHFEQMVKEMVDVRLRFEGQLPLSQYDRRSTERLIAELKSSVLPPKDEGGQS